MLVEVMGLEPTTSTLRTSSAWCAANVPPGWAGVAIVLKALSQNLDQKVGDIFSTARLGKELRGDQGAHLAYSSCIPLFALPDYARCW